MIANEGTSGLDARELISLTHSWPSPGRIWSAVIGLRNMPFPEGVVSNAVAERSRGTKLWAPPLLPFDQFQNKNDAVEIFLLEAVILLLKFAYPNFLFFPMKK